MHGGELAVAVLTCLGSAYTPLLHMKILIENAVTREFLTSEGRWTKKSDQGASFATTRSAHTAAKREPIGKFNIVGHISGTVQFFNLENGSGQGA